MSTVSSPEPLPNDPSLEQLRKQARELQREKRAEDPTFTLSAAQRDVARHYGFASWPRLVHHLEVVTRYSWRPDDEPDDEPDHDRLLRFACLTYGDDDGPERWQRARALLDADPSLTRASAHTAAACADAAALGEMLRADRSLALAQGGPFAWEPLMYLAYARHVPEVSEPQVVASARALLDYGADPNVGYLWHGMPSPFTALTGVFGEGELGPKLQPRHPHSLALARVLLEAGADANDSQTLYNRMFDDDDDHLVLLLEYGLGAGDGGPWRARLGDAIDAPATLLRKQLRWAVIHDQRARVALLLAHDVDANTTFADGRSAIDLAAMSGHREVVDALRAAGGADAVLDPIDAFIAAAFSHEPIEVPTEVLARAKEARPGLVVWAASRGNREAVTTLLALGFDIDAKARTDVPIEQEWETALHAAVSHADRGMVELLLAAGADPTIRDARFDAMPLGWARHAGNEELIELLAPVTPSEL
ncbi:MAG TPA: ankyrin repeat domain-containing protein [Acidimicrobiales bacterium]|nr:ankyrin repeat domain-containing protein [Acidimicrobiales bacterium]